MASMLLPGEASTNSLTGEDAGDAVTAAAAAGGGVGGASAAGSPVAADKGKPKKPTGPQVKEDLPDWLAVSKAQLTVFIDENL